MELVDCWWDLQTGLEDSLLPLQTNVLGPFHKSAQITLRLDVLSDFKVTRSGNEEWVLYSLNFRFFNCKRGGCHLLSLLLGLKNLDVRESLMRCLQFALPFFEP